MKPIEEIKAKLEALHKLRCDRALIILRHKSELSAINQKLSAGQADLSSFVATAAQKETEHGS